MPILPAMCWRVTLNRHRAFDVLAAGCALPPKATPEAATNDERVKLWFNATIAVGIVTGGSVIADTGLWVSGTTPNNNVGWQLMATVFKYGAAGSNTQYAQGTAISAACVGGSACRSFRERASRALLSLPDRLVLHDRGNQRCGCHLV